MRTVWAVLLLFCMVDTAFAEECDLIRDSPMSDLWLNDMMKDGKYYEQPTYHILMYEKEKEFGEYERRAKECYMEILDDETIILREIIADKHNRDREFTGNIWINWTWIIEEGKPHMADSTFICEIFEVPQMKIGERIHFTIRNILIKASNFIVELL